MRREQRQIDLNQAGEPEVDETPDELVLPAIPAEMAAQIRRIYVGCYREVTGKYTYGDEPLPQWDGGETQFGRRCQPIWPKIAKRVVELGLEPLGFIRAQFWCRGAQQSRPPAPSYLLSDEALARYRVYQQQAVVDARQEYQRNLQSVQSGVLLATSGLGWDYRRALRYALANISTVHASELFRYCLASAEGIVDVANHFHDQALAQYVFQRDMFDAAWGDKIPHLLREEGEVLRRRILGG